MDRREVEEEGNQWRERRGEKDDQCWKGEGEEEGSMIEESMQNSMEGRPEQPGVTREISRFNHDKSRYFYRF